MSGREALLARRLAVSVAVLGIAASLAVAAGAAPTQRTVEILAQADKTFAPRDFHADRGESLKVLYTNGDFFGSHDIVFELERGRVVRTDVIGPFSERTLTFDAPPNDGVFVYYSSVGSDRADGMAGNLFVGDAQATPTPTATRPPADVPYTTVLGDLHNPHGLSARFPELSGSVAATDTASVLVSEGGTGGPGTGAFQPGNADGRVLSVPLDSPNLYSVVVHGLTNSVDPGGGVVGANHAIPWDMESAATGTASVVLVAVAGGPAHASPSEAAKVLAIDGDGNRTVIADTLAFEQENNPDGEDPESGGIDSNPWRLVPDPDGESVYIVDAGANDILKLNPATHELSLYAVFEHVAEDQQAVPSGMVWSPYGDGSAIVSLLGGFGPATGQLRLLRDSNDDGNALGADENVMLADALALPSDIALHPDGSALYIAELGLSRVSVFELERAFAAATDEVGSASGAAARPSQGNLIHPAAAKLYGVSALAFEPTGALLAAVYGWPGDGGGPQLQTDRIVRVAAEVVQTPTPTPRVNTPTVTPSPTATATSPSSTPEPAAGGIFLPAVLKKGRFP